MHIVIVLILYFKVAFNTLVQSNMLEGDFHGDLRVITYRVPGNTNGFNILVLVHSIYTLTPTFICSMFVRRLEIVLRKDCASIRQDSIIILMPSASLQISKNNSQVNQQG